jgi:hypothetical protein
MKLRSPAGLLAGLTAALAIAPAAHAAPANVQVRAEGATATVLPRTAVTTTTDTVNKDGQAGHDCTGTSAAGALERATGGDWGGTWFDGLGYAVDRIRGEQSNPSGTYWALWINYRFSDLGLCQAELQNGDDILLYIDCFAGCPSPKPLRLTGVPATAAPGATTVVKVETFEVSGFPSVTQPVPAPGAGVQVGGRTYTTGPDGSAQVTFEGSGPVTVQASKAGHVRSAAEQTCVTTGGDGACGTTKPPKGGPPPVPAADTTAPVARITGIRNRQRFARGPRELRGTVSDDSSGIRAVKLRLTRRLGRACWYFSGSRERFLRRRCGTDHAFRIGDRAQWRYLLPARLARGRYALEVYAIDRAGNQSAPQRVVFTVR